MGNWNWHPDCGGDQVIDHGTDDRALLVTAFACAYPDGDGAASITIGNDLDPIVRIDVDEESQGRAMAACEEWLDKMVPLVREAIREKLEEHSDDGSAPEPPSLDYIKEGDVEPSEPEPPERERRSFFEIIFGK